VRNRLVELLLVFAGLGGPHFEMEGPQVCSSPCVLFVHGIYTTKGVGLHYAV
jgi:hypothetical protein